MAIHNFPCNIIEFQDRFGDEGSCRTHLASLKWPAGYRCRKCGCAKFFLIATRNIYQCAHCRDQESLTADTIMHKTRKPLRLWFMAIYLTATSKRGISAAELGRKLGIGSKTAWTWLCKIRLALGRREKQRLRGVVEVDEVYIGGRSEGGKRGRGSESKTPVVFAIENQNGKIGRLRLGAVAGVDELSLHRFIRGVAVEGTTLKTDGLKSYNLMKTQGYALEQTVATESEESGRPTPAVHLAASLVKRWLLGTHQGRVTPRHLPMYLDEFEYRFNRRKVKNEGRLAELMLAELAGASPDTYREIIDRKNSAKASNAG